MSELEEAESKLVARNVAEDALRAKCVMASERLHQARSRSDDSAYVAEQQLRDAQSELDHARDAGEGAEKNVKRLRTIVDDIKKTLEAENKA